MYQFIGMIVAACTATTVNTVIHANVPPDASRRTRFQIGVGSLAISSYVGYKAGSHVVAEIKAVETQLREAVAEINKIRAEGAAARAENVAVKKAATFKNV